MLSNIRNQSRNRRVIAAKFMSTVKKDQLDPIHSSRCAQLLQSLKFLNPILTGEKIISMSKLNAKSARINKARKLCIPKMVQRIKPRPIGMKARFPAIEIGA